MGQVSNTGAGFLSKKSSSYQKKPVAPVENLTPTHTPLLTTYYRYCLMFYLYSAMFEKSLHEIAFHLGQVLQYGVPHGFRAIEVYFDPHKKPVMLINATHLLEYMGSEKKDWC